MKRLGSTLVTALLVAILGWGFGERIDGQPPDGSTAAASQQRYEIAFSTYLGARRWEHARDVTVDTQGNVYVVGGTSSPNFPTTGGAHDRRFDSGGQAIGGAGDCDAFVAKFDARGKLLWSTYLGGPNYDRAYGVKVDQRGGVYVAGRCGPGFPVTDGAFQTEYCGGKVGFYGSQNAFVCKLKPDGSGLDWSSYVGIGALCRDLVIDAAGDVYLPLVDDIDGHKSPSWFEGAFAGAYQQQRKGGTECGVVKVSSDGSRVHWATWLGGSGDEIGRMSIRLDPQGNVCVCFDTESADLPTTDGAMDRTYSGKHDGYVAKLTADGSRLLMGTYIGGSGEDFVCNTHNLAVDPEGNIFVSVWTRSSDFPTTAGAFDRQFHGAGEIAVAKLSPAGALLASTSLSGSKAEEAEGIAVDAGGNVLVTGRTQSPDFPVTDGAFRYGGGPWDGLVVVLSPDLSKLQFATFLGGRAYDFLRSCAFGPDGSLHVIGSTNGAGWPVRNAIQPAFAGTNDGRWGNGDCILAKFSPTANPDPSRLRSEQADSLGQAPPHRLLWRWRIGTAATTFIVLVGLWGGIVRPAITLEAK